MKAQRLPQESILLKGIENLQEIIWAKITSAVRGFIKTYIKNLLNKELYAQINAGWYEIQNTSRVSERSS